VHSAREPVSRILCPGPESCGGHSSRRRVAADAHQRPTRRFRHCMERPFGRTPAKSRLNASGRCAAPPGSGRLLPSLFGLAPCGVYPASGITAGAVRSYRTFSPLPGLAVQAYALRAGGPHQKLDPECPIQALLGWGSTNPIVNPGCPVSILRPGKPYPGGMFSVALAVHGP
jgi:hypothetical protein